MIKKNIEHKKATLLKRTYTQKNKKKKTITKKKNNQIKKILN